jgi:hypothetical protein
MTDEALPTPRSIPHGYVVSAWCRACQHTVRLDLPALVADGHGDVPLIHLPLRCRCGSDQFGHHRRRSRHREVAAGTQRMNLLHITDTTVIMALIVAVLAGASQIAGYRSTALAQRTLLRKLALGLGLAAVGVSLVIGWNAINWGDLPDCSEGLPGPCSNGGEVAVSPVYKPR